MRLKVALATAALALVAASSALAGPLPLEVQFTGASTTPLTPPTTAYSAIIFNPTGSDVFIGSDGFGLPDGVTVPFDGLTDPDIGAITDPAGLLVPAGGSLQFDDLFELSSPSLGTYVLFSPDGVQLSGPTDFTPGGFNTPEPGAVAMLVSSGLVGSGFLIRRRRRK